MDEAVRIKRPTYDEAEVGSVRARTARRLARVGMLLALAAAAVLGWNLFSAQRAAAQLKADTEVQAVVPVAVTKPERLADDIELVLPGNLLAHYEAPIYARTSGYLRRWLVDIGTPVKAGQLLAVIDSPEVDQALHQAEADLASAEANQRIARVTAERWRNLRNTDSVSRQDADQRISQAEAADAQVESARANVRRLRELAGFDKIVAPFDGVITARDTDVGQLINSGSGTGPELFRIADMRRLRLYVRVPQPYAAAMQKGVTTELELPDRRGKRYAAQLDRTASAIDTTSRTLLVELIVDNKGGELLPGAYSEVHFKLPSEAHGSSSFKVPANVLLFRGDGPHIATVDGHEHIVMKSVEIGRDYGSAIEIVRGLDPQDQIVLSPPDSLAEGVAVRVTSATGGEAARS